MNARIWKSIALCLLFFGVLLGVAEAREWAAGRAAVVASDAARAHGDPRQAIRYARSAAEAAVPFSPYPDEAYARLVSIARDAEGLGDLDVAGFAWRASRSAAVATRPAAAARGRVAEADLALLHLARSSARTSLGAHGVDEAVLRDELAVLETPSPWLSLLVTLGTLSLTFGLASLTRILRTKVPVA